MTKPTIRNEKDGSVCEQEDGDTILRAALRAGLGVSYECNSGGCGGCKFELLAGEIETLWADAPGLTERDRKRGRHLACQCRALGPVSIKAATAPEYQPKILPRRQRAHLIGTRDITHDIREFRFRSEDDAEFLPGQFAMLDIPGLSASRAYSLSNTANERREWHFQIRRVLHGQGTPALFEKLAEGDEIGLDGPYGVAYLRTDSPRDMVCVAGGSGLAPMISLARGAVEAVLPADRKLYFFYGARTPRDVCGEEMLRVLAGFGERIVYVPVVSLPGDNGDWRGETGFAHDVGPAGMMTNPATLSLMPEGDQIMVGLDLVTTDIDVKNQATGTNASSSSHSHNRVPYLAPELAYAKRIGAWAFGVGAFAQGGLGTEYGSDSFLLQATGGLATGLENSSRLLVLNIPFAASFQVNEQLAIGGSIDAMWQGLNLNLLLGADQVGSLIGAGRVNGSLVPVLGGLPDLRGAHFSLTKNQPLASGVDSWGVGGRLSLVYKATPDTTFGASYSFKSSMGDMEGNATLTAVDGLAGQIPLNGKIKIIDFQMPAHLELGFSHRVSPQWTVAADLSQVFWKSVMENINVAFVADNGLNVNILLPQDYKDQNILALGTAYQLDDNWTLRGGLRFASQALRSSTLFAVIPATPKTHLSAGVTYAFSKQSKLDFAYSHAFEETMDNASLPNTSAPIEVRHAQNNASISYRYSF